MRIIFVSLPRVTAKGFGLVELMIAVALGLLITVGILQVFLGSKDSHRMQKALSEVQQAGSYAIHFLKEDILMAGYMGCASIDSVNVNILTKTPPSDLVFDADTILVGVDNLAEGNGLDAVVGSDSITIRRGSIASAQLSGDMFSDSASVEVEVNQISAVSGDYLMISDCLSSDLFRASTITSGSDMTIEHGDTVNASASLSKIYRSDAEVYAFESIVYFIKDTGRQNPQGGAIYGLFVQRRSLGTGGTAPAAVELIEGVENMQLNYGEDTDADLKVNRYVSAAGVSSWANVLSVKIELLLSANSAGVVGDSGTVTAQELNFAGARVSNNDGRYRRVLSSVVAIRNKLP
jgi:type IV pilus assembly protein PilW